MNAIVAAATAELADLAYDVYVETLEDLRTVRIGTVDLMEAVQQLADSTGGFEAEALSTALCDYIANVPQRSREQFCQLMAGAQASERRG
jgi:hypothetical protein